MKPAPLRLLDLFAGIGGFSYAAEVLLDGFQTVQFVELDPFCCKVLRAHWPRVPIHDDIRTFAPAAGTADIVTAGFPCQDISVAGKGAGIRSDTRSGLFFEAMRVVRLVRPRFVVLENVPAIRSRGLNVVLGELAASGFDAEWACVRAADVGACHRRDRWWCVAYPTRLFGNGGTGQQPGQLGRRSVPKSGDGDGAHADHAISHRLERSKWQGPHTATWPQAGLRLLDPNWGGYVSQPVLCRGDDGLSGRVDRLKALGNAVVPQVASVPLRRVLELSERA